MKLHYKSPIKRETELGYIIELYDKYKIDGSSYEIYHTLFPKNSVYNNKGYDLYKFSIDKKLSEYLSQGRYFLNYIIVEGNIELYYENNKGLNVTDNEISKFKDIVETIMHHKQDENHIRNQHS